MQFRIPHFNFAPKLVHAFGLDIGHSHIRIVDLEKSDALYRLRVAGTTTLPDGVITAQGIVQPEKFVASLHTLLGDLRRHHNLGPTVIVSLPEPSTYLLTIPAPKCAPEDQAAAITTAAFSHLPLDPEETIIDWNEVGPINRRRILIGAAPKTIVTSTAQVLTQAGLLPIAIELDACSISRALMPSLNSAMVQLIIKIGARETQLIIVDNKEPAFARIIPIGSQDITDVIVTTLEIQPAMAEHAKRKFGFDASLGEGITARVLTNCETMAQLVRGIHHTIAYWQTHAEDNPSPITHAWLTGDGSLVPGLTSYMTHELHLEVASGDHSRMIENHQTDPLPPSFITAIGLAMRGAS